MMNKLYFKFLAVFLLLSTNIKAEENAPVTTPLKTEPTQAQTRDESKNSSEVPVADVSTPPEQTSSTQIYTNTEKNYSIKHPSDWKHNDVPRLDFVLFIPPKDTKEDSYASMNIVSDKVGSDITLTEFYADSSANLSKALKDVHIEKAGETQLSGVKAKWILYTHKMRDIKFRVLQYFIVANGTVYLLTFSSSAKTFDQYRHDFEDVANTFLLIAPQE